jgi:hypothetical protein
MGCRRAENGEAWETRPVQPNSLQLFWTRRFPAVLKSVPDPEYMHYRTASTRWIVGFRVDVSSKHGLPSAVPGRGADIDTDASFRSSQCAITSCHHCPSLAHSEPRP